MAKKKLQRLEQSMQQAENYRQWKTAAVAHDLASGAARWKAQERSRIYDYAAVRERLEQLRLHRSKGDDYGLLFSLNEGIHGNFGGMGKSELYQRARFGTKDLITEYLDELCSSLEHIANVDISGISHDDKLDFFRRASLCFGRSALLLSGGGIYGNFHAGVVRALVAHDLLPDVISGSSAGALMTALIGCHKTSELDGMLSLDSMRIMTDQDARRGIVKRLTHADIRGHIDRLIPDLTFAEAYERTGIYINISISPAVVHQSSRLMNAITSPQVCVRSAVLASCSIPGLYPPTQLTAKNREGEIQPYLPGRRWVDGSVSDDVPAQRLARLYAVNHYIVSQVNPFALINRPKTHSGGVGQDVLQLVHHTSKNAVKALQSVVDRYGRRWPNLRHNLNSAMSVWLQDYGGDINLLPPVGMVRPWKALILPTDESMQRMIRAGELATWQRVEMIRNCTRVSCTLEDILARLDPDNDSVPRLAAGNEWREARALGEDEPKKKPTSAARKAGTARA